MCCTQKKQINGWNTLIQVYCDQTCSPSAILVLACSGVASFPGSRPASRRLQYGTASDEKLGEGLGMRLALVSKYILMTKVCTHNNCS